MHENLLINKLWPWKCLLCNTQKCYIINMGPKMERKSYLLVMTVTYSVPGLLSGRRPRVIVDGTIVDITCFIRSATGIYTKSFIICIIHKWHSWLYNTFEHRNFTTCRWHENILKNWKQRWLPYSSVWYKLSSE